MGFDASQGLAMCRRLLQIWWAATMFAAVVLPPSAAVQNFKSDQAL